MKQLFFCIFFLVASVFTSLGHNSTNAVMGSTAINSSTSQLEYLCSQYKINQEAIQMALAGYHKLRQLGKLTNLQYLTIADFSKPSNEERLFIIDMHLMQVVVKSLVAHGRNSGIKMANHFSNNISSFQSSLGFYITGGVFKGKHGASLELNGVEKGINDQAKQRAIVIHGADYVSNKFIQQQGFIGRSLGCPAVPQKKAETIINTIKGASCLFIYSINSPYKKQSHFIQ